MLNSMERRVTGNCHARCGAGEKLEVKKTKGLPIAIGVEVTGNQTLDA